MCIAVVVTLRLRVAKVNEGGLEGHYKPQETTGARAVGPLRRCGRHGKNSRMMTRDTATVGGGNTINSSEAASSRFAEKN